MTDATQDESERTAIVKWAGALLGVLVIWLVVRVVFFEGFQGSDDFSHVRFAYFWDRVPVDHWEARVLYNGLLFVAFKVFGFGEVSGALPGLLGSLLLLGAGMWIAWIVSRAMWMVLLTGLFLACMPIDVCGSTTPCATKTLATGLLAMGLALLLRYRGWRAVLLAGLFGALSIFTHTAVMFIVAIVLVSVGLVDRARRRDVIAAAAAAGAGALLLNVIVFGLWTGDPLHRFHIISQVHLGHMDVDANARWVTTATGDINWSFFLQPVVDLLASKSFGFFGLVAVVGGLAFWRRCSRAGRTMIVALGLSWLWMSFGTHSPKAYLAFPGTTAYWQPFTLLFALIAAELCRSVRPSLAVSTATALVLSNVLLLASSGSWGQSVEISRELLVYARAHSNESFVADDRTLTEMYVLNEFKMPPNVRRISDSKGPTFGRAAIVDSQVLAAGEVLVLENPLNTCREPAFVTFLKAHSGRLRYQSDARCRMICRVVPPLQRYAFAVRKPPGRVLASVQ